MGFRSALFIVPDESALESLKASPQYSLFRPDVRSERSGAGSKELLSAVSDPAFRYGVVYISADLVSVSPLNLLRAAREHHVGTPIYLITDRSPLEASELPKLGLQGELPVPRSLDELPVPPFLAVEAFFKAEASGKVVKLAPAPADPEYVPVRIEEFFSQGTSAFDVYLRLGEARHVKILSANDSLDLSRALSYHAQGVRELYVKRAALDRCLGYHAMLARRLFALPKVSASLKISQLEVLALRIEAMASAATLTGECVEEAGQFVDELFGVVDRSGLSARELAQEYLRRFEHLTHASSISFVAALLSIPLGIRNPKNRRQLGLAAIFHDIALARLPEKLWKERVEDLEPAERELLEGHPAESVRILSRHPELDALGLRAIEQHHERRNTMGYPRGLGAGDVDAFAEIIGISDELVRALEEGTHKPVEERLREFRARFRDSFSVEVLDAFGACFLGTQA